MIHGLSMLLSLAPESGGYFNPAKLIVFCALVVPWLWACAWADKDSKAARMPRTIWMPAVVGSGVVGTIVWLMMPNFFVGMGVYIVLVLAVAAVYIMQRNAKVVPEARVMTGEWFANILQRRKDRSVDLVAKLKVYDSKRQPAVPPADGTVAEKQTYNDVQDLLHDVMWRRASEVDLRGAQQEIEIRYVIDGMVVKCDPLERSTGEPMMDYIKGLAGMDVEEKRRPQTGKIAVDLAGQQIDIDIIAAGSTSGPRMQMKVVQEAVRTRVEELGLPDAMLAQLREVTDIKTGLILVAAKAKNGLTSTLYSLMRDHDAYTSNLMMVEAKPEADLENVTQNPYEGDEAMAGVLAGVLRRDPDVVMVDNCATAEGVERIINGTQQAKILLGVRASDSFNALAKWVKVAGDASKAVGPLKAVVSQVLLRKLCPACREAYQPPAEMLKKANLPADKVECFYRPPTEPLTDEKGRPVTCPTCQGSGYFGRTAAFELLIIDKDLRKLIAKGANLTQIKAAARKNKMLYLQEQGLRLAMQGITSVQEVIRVTRSSKAKAKVKAKAKAEGQG